MKFNLSVILLCLVVLESHIKLFYLSLSKLYSYNLFTFKAMINIKLIFSTDWDKG
jgi:hypothetical protein